MITYKSVTKIFGSGKDAVTALDSINFVVPNGEIVVLLGPSGCGKTTTLRLTNRLETVTQGNIFIENQNIMDINPVELRQRLGYVIQAIGLFPNKTIAENISVVPNLLGWKKDKTGKRVDEMLQLVNLQPDIYRNRYPAELSGGQQQRVGVARGLAADPDILLMDEPFGAIDPINREQIQNEFLKLQAQLKKTIVFVSHDIHEAIKVGDRIALFDKGKLIQYDSPEVILTQPKNKFVADFVGADRALKVLGLITVSEVMNHNPKNLVRADERTEHALKFINDKKFRYGIVINGSMPVGYVTPAMLTYGEGIVLEVAEKYPLFLKEHTSLRDVLSFMLMYDLTAFCVLDDNGNFTGTVTYHDIQHVVKKSYTDEAASDEGAQ